MPNRSHQRRVLHIHFGKEGGAERFFVSLCQSLAAAGVEQRFLIRPRRSWRNDLAVLGKVREVNYPRLFPFRQLLQRWVDQQVRTWQPDAIIAWMPKAATLLPGSDAPARLVRLGDFPRHVDHFQRADCIIGNTPGVRDRLDALSWDRPVEIISNFPRDNEADPDRVSFDLPPGHFVLCAAGRFVGLKGFDSLVRAMAMVDNTALCLVGDGEKRSELEELAAELGVAHRLQITGWVDRPMDWLAKSDLICVTSTHEVLGNVVLEAWQCRVPVVSTPTPGPRWLIEDGMTGVMLSDFEPETLAEGIERVLTSAGLRETLVRHGAEKLASSFSRDQITRLYLEIIDRFGAGYG